MAEIEQLRELLFKREQQRLDDLEAELRDREQRIDALGEVLPESLNRLQDDKQLQQSLKPQLIRGIETTIRSNPKRFAMMFYPVIGPAIRRAISEALKGLLENINHTMENSFSARSWRWRFEAWRSGVPFNQIVLKHTLAYSIDEVFLVQRDSGLLLARSARDADEVLDRDAVAAMLTAIQRFMQESFDTDDDHPVRSIEIGEHTLWIIPGRDASLVALIQGAISREARGELQHQLEQIHDGYEVLLRSYQQHSDSPDHMLSGLEDDLSGCLLRKQLAQDSGRNSKGKKQPIMLWLLLLAILVVLGWQLWQWWWLDRDRDQLIGKIQQTPGWVLMTDAIDGDQIKIKALRDPLAATPESLTDGLAIDQAKVQFILEDYQSTAASLALQRLSNAVSVDRSQLQLDTIVGSGNLQTFNVNGVLPRSTWQSLRQLAGAFGLQAKNVPPVDIDNLKAALAPPAGTEVQWRGDILEISGEHIPAWHKDLTEKLTALGISAQINDLSTDFLERRINSLQQRWNGHLLSFEGGVQLTADSTAVVTSLVQEIQAILRLSDSDELPFTITLSGLTDGRFNAPVNVALREQRAVTIRNQMIATGIDADVIGLRDAENASGNNDARAVRIHLAKSVDN